jgi:hypothetical protein
MRLVRPVGMRNETPKSAAGKFNVFETKKCMDVEMEV